MNLFSEIYSPAYISIRVSLPQDVLAIVYSVLHCRLNTWTATCTALYRRLASTISCLDRRYRSTSRLTCGWSRARTCCPTGTSLNEVVHVLWSSHPQPVTSGRLSRRSRSRYSGSRVRLTRTTRWRPKTGMSPPSLMTSPTSNNVNKKYAALENYLLALKIGWNY